MLNNITIMGRLVADPELRQTQNDIAVCSLRIACEQDFSKKGEDRKADFFNCVAWRGTAEFVARYFGKGRLITLVGRLQNTEWTDNDGNKRRDNEIVVERAYFCDSAKKDAGGDSGDDFGPLPEIPDFDGDGDLPF